MDIHLLLCIPYITEAHKVDMVKDNLPKCCLPKVQRVSINPIPPGTGGGGGAFDTRTNFEFDTKEQFLDLCQLYRPFLLHGSI